MKKILAMLIAAVMVFSLAACGGSSSSGTEQAADVKTEAAQEEQAEDEAEEDEAESSDNKADDAAEDKYYSLTFEVRYGTTAAITETLTAYCDKIKEVTDGHVEIMINVGGSLYSVNEMAEGVSEGILDIGEINSTYTPEMFSLSNFTTIPGQGFDDNIKATELIWDLYETDPDMAAQWDDEYKVLMLYACPAMPSITPVNNYITSLDQVEGKEVKVKSGVTGICMNQDRWDSLPKKYQEAIESVSGHEMSIECAEAQKEFAISIYEGLDMTELRDEMTVEDENGDGFYCFIPTEEECPGWQDFCDRLAAEWAEEVTAATGVDGETYLAHAKELYEGY